MPAALNTQPAPNYKARIAWSMGVMIFLGLLLPAFQPARESISPRTPITSPPHDYSWIVAAVAVVLAVIPWIPRRFSVRGLLILMTLVAGGLSLCVWMARNNSLATH